MLFKILRVLLILGVILVVALIGVTFALPTETSIENQIAIEAPRPVIHASVAELRTWQDWTIWNHETDPDCTFEFEDGPGEGAIMRWNGKTMGVGSMTIVEASVETGIRYTVNTEGFEPIRGTIEYQDGEDGETVVVWRDDMSAGGLAGRWFLVLANMAMKPLFRKNLENLEIRSEAAAQAAGAGGDAVEASMKKNG